MFGKDFFWAWIVKKNEAYVVYPFGSNGDGSQCTSNSGTWNTSWGCSARALSANGI